MKAKVTFLDLRITLCTLTNKLVFSLYIKPTNTFSPNDESLIINTN